MAFYTTKKLVELLEHSEEQMLTSRLTAMQNWNKNSSGVEIPQFGHVKVFTVKEIPGPLYNSVRGMRDENRLYIDPILLFFKERSIPARFEFAPTQATSTLFKTLHEKGFYQSYFRTVLYAPMSELSLKEKDQRHPKVTVRPLQKNEFPMFGDLYVQGFGMPDSAGKLVGIRNQILYDTENWFFYVAYVDDEPAGVAVLFVQDGLATLAAGATIPKFRNHGIQKALIKARMDQAKSMGCQYIISTAQLGSVSQANMEKLGMKIAYIKTVWEPYANEF